MPQKVRYKMDLNQAYLVLSNRNVGVIIEFDVITLTNVNYVARLRVQQFN